MSGPRDVLCQGYDSHMTVIEEYNSTYHTDYTGCLTQAALLYKHYTSTGNIEVIQRQEWSEISLDLKMYRYCIIFDTHT